VPPSASLPYSALFGTVHDLDAVDRRLIDHVEERVDAAALRAVRVADAVDVTLTLLPVRPRTNTPAMLGLVRCRWTPDSSVMASATTVWRA
jgi:hypothetical protein